MRKHMKKSLQLKLIDNNTKVLTVIEQQINNNDK